MQHHCLYIELNEVIQRTWIAELSNSFRLVVTIEVQVYRIPEVEWRRLMECDRGRRAPWPRSLARDFLIEIRRPGHEITEV